MFNKVIIINNHSIMPSIIYDKHKRKNQGHITQCNFVTAGPLLKGLQIWAKVTDQNFGPFFPTGPALLNFIKILSLFNTQPNRPRASPTIFKHVGQVPYSRGFKFGEKGPIKILAHFFLQVRRY